MGLRTALSLVVIFQSVTVVAESLRDFNAKLKSQSPFEVSLSIIRETHKGTERITEVSEEEAKCVTLQMNQLSAAQKLLHMDDQQIQEMIPLRLNPVVIEIRRLAFPGANAAYFMPKYSLEVVPNGGMTRSTLTLMPSPQTCELVTAAAIAEAIPHVLSVKAKRAYSQLQ